MVATAGDLALFGVALRSGRLLKPQSMQLMKEWRPAWPSIEAGLGVFRTQYPGDLFVIGHNGDVLGFSATLYWIEDFDAVVAVVSNVGTWHSGDDVPGSAYSVGKDHAFIEQVKKMVANKPLVPISD